MEFNFDKSKELKTAKPAETPVDAKELIDNTSEGLENSHEIDKADEPTKAVVTYIGRGIWKDSKGVDWAHDKVHSFEIEEFEAREDLRFMIGYGAMKVSLV